MNKSSVPSHLYIVPCPVSPTLVHCLPLHLYIVFTVYLPFSDFLYIGSLTICTSLSISSKFVHQIVHQFIPLAPFPFPQNLYIVLLSHLYIPTDCTSIYTSIYTFGSFTISFAFPQNLYIVLLPHLYIPPCKLYIKLYIQLPYYL